MSNSVVTTLETDILYRQEYEKFVQAMSYADDDEKLLFDKAIEVLKAIIALF